MKPSTALAITLLFTLTGCAAARDFRDPTQRITRHTAYTLQRGQMRVGLGLFGQEPDNLGGQVEFAVGYADWGHLSVNLLHAAFGVVNLAGEFNMIDWKHFALGASLGVTWLKPQFLWFLPEQAREDFGGFSALSVPAKLETSYPVNDWLHFDLGLGYIWAGIFGEVGQQSSVFGGGLGTRQFYARPAVHFHVRHKVDLYVKSKWLLHGQHYASIYSEVEMHEGVVASVETVDWRRMAFLDGSNLSLGIEWKFKKHFYMNLWLMYNGPFTRWSTDGRRGLAGLEAKWRF